MFVVLEGVDGSGKSTQARLVSEKLRQSGYKVLSTREPGGSKVSECIRDILLGDEELDVWTEAMLMAAARVEHCRRTVLPALAEGAIVVSDRYIGSSLVYQGVSRGVDPDAIMRLNHLSPSVIEPDLVVLLDLDRPRKTPDATPFESRGPKYWYSVRDAYRELASRLDWMVLDASQSVENLSTQIQTAIHQIALGRGLVTSVDE